jgi:acetoin utilization protein AcuB
MRVFEAMTKSVRTAPRTMTAARAYELMKTAGVHHLVVTDDSRVVGVLSDRDIAPRRRASAAVAPAAIETLMSSPVVTVQKNDTVRKAANLMRGRTIGCLPVMDRGKLIGIVTTSDVLRLLGHGAGVPGEGTRATLSHRVKHAKRHLPDGRW